MILLLQFAHCFIAKWLLSGHLIQYTVVVYLVLHPLRAVLARSAVSYLACCNRVVIVCIHNL